jgi:hypothetical protein
VLTIRGAFILGEIAKAFLSKPEFGRIYPMRNSLMDKKIDILTDYGLPLKQSISLCTSSLYFQVIGGTKMDAYWNDSKLFDIRDEFYLVSNSYISVLRISQQIDAMDWLLKFQVAYLFQFKQNLQSIKSIDILTDQKCYADAFAVCRAMQSRANLLMLCSLEPNLFDHWLKNPKDPRFLDGHIKRELESNGLNTMDHIYELASEIIHGHLLGHSNIGFFTKGIFNYIPAIRNQIYVVGKFLLSIVAYSVLQATLIINPHNEDLREMDELYNYFFGSVLAFSRLDNLWALIAEDRHWKKVGKKRFIAGSSYNFEQYREQLIKFHKPLRQKKRLSKEYLS